MWQDRIRPVPFDPPGLRFPDEIPPFATHEDLKDYWKRR